MADETKTEAQKTEETPQAETDWQAKYEEMRGHMRDWEKKAKANQSAAEELERLKAEQMTEQEREKARADAAEAELAALKAEKERTDAAHRIASETGVPLDLLLYCTDEESMTDFAKKYASETHVGSAPSALSGKRIVRGNDKPAGDGEVFAEFASQFFK